MKVTATYEFEVSDEEVGKSIDKALKKNPNLVFAVRCKDCIYFQDR
mgnify:CR=1 FL=1